MIMWHSFGFLMLYDENKYLFNVMNHVVYVIYIFCDDILVWRFTSGFFTTSMKCIDAVWNVQIVFFFFPFLVCSITYVNKTSFITQYDAFGIRNITKMMGLMLFIHF